MRSFILSLVAGAVSLGVGIAGASADTPHPLSGTYSRDQMRGICVGNGGEYYEHQGGFGCRKQCTGGTCAVDCADGNLGPGQGNCTGWTPARIVNPTIPRILAGIAARPPAAGPLDTTPGGTPTGPSGVGTPKPTAPPTGKLY